MTFDPEGLSALRFIQYMRTRWADDEKRHCAVGYAEEWAYRFKTGFEWETSDFEGHEILRKMGKELKT